MEAILRTVSRNTGATVGVILLVAVGIAYASILGMSPEDQEALLYTVQDFLPIMMFLTLAVLLFSGFPVAFILGGIAFLFGLIGYFLDVFSLIEFFNFMPRIWFQGAENLVLVAIPGFVFMGVMMERGGIAEDLLYCVQVLLKGVAGSLAIAVTIMGTILAAMTGIIGASVTMMTSLALPTMMRQGYSHSLSCGVIAASGTLGILIPPSIMLIIMADLMAVSVGSMFMAALMPGLVLAALYLIFVGVYARLRPEVAPPLPPELLNVPKGELMHGFDGKVTACGLAAVAAAVGGWIGVIPTVWATWLAIGFGFPALFLFAGPLIRKAFIPPVVLIGMIKGSILFGIATPSEAGAVGAFGVLLLTLFAGRLNFTVLQGVCHSAARTIAMIFFIIISATCFAYVYRSLGGDDIVHYLVTSAGVDSWELLILLMVMTFFLGFFLDFIEITLIVLPVFAPLVASMDFGDHIATRDIIYWFLILMAINLQTSFLTPPFGFALFYLKGIAPKEIKIQEIYKGIIPFVLLQLTGLILVMWKPNIALWLMKAVYDY